MLVAYKFRASLEFKKLEIRASHITAGDLKDKIFQQEKINKNTCDLTLENEGDKRKFEDDEKIPKNSFIIVYRVPLDPSVAKRRRLDNPEVLLNNSKYLKNKPEENAASFKLQRQAIQAVDISRMQGTEDDKIRVMMAQSTIDYHPSRYVHDRYASKIGKVPHYYHCPRCSQKGKHHVSNCPQKKLKIPTAHGIPREQLRRVDDPNTPGVMRTPRGDLVVYKGSKDVHSSPQQKDIEKYQKLPPVPACESAKILNHEESVAPPRQDSVTSAPDKILPGNCAISKREAEGSSKLLQIKVDHGRPSSQDRANLCPEPQTPSPGRLLYNRRNSNLIVIVSPEMSSDGLPQGAQEPGYAMTNSLTPLYGEWPKVTTSQSYIFDQSYEVQRPFEDPLAEFNKFLKHQDECKRGENKAFRRIVNDRKTRAENRTRGVKRMREDPKEAES